MTGEIMTLFQSSKVTIEILTDIFSEPSHINVQSCKTGEIRQFNIESPANYSNNKDLDALFAIQRAIKAAIKIERGERRELINTNCQ
jgi:hypothetical protein